MIIAYHKKPDRLEELLAAVRSAAEGETAIGFTDPSGIPDRMNGHQCHIVFLDLTEDGNDILRLAGEMKRADPRVNIVFTAPGPGYGAEAMALHASGYIVLPVTAEKIKNELRDLRYPLPEKNVFRKSFYIRTFGAFEVYGNGVPLRFHYSKTKELFAYLVDRRGASCSNGELMAVLWEDDGISHLSYLKNLKHDLRCALKLLGHEDLLVSSKGGVAVAIRPCVCDYFDRIGHVPGAPEYRGEYMTQYSWAEMTHAALEMERRKKA